MLRLAEADAVGAAGDVAVLAAGVEGPGGPAALVDPVVPRQAVAAQPGPVAQREHPVDPEHRLRQQPRAVASRMPN